MTINNKIPTSCKTDLLTGQQFIGLLPIYCPLSNCWPMALFSLVHVILTSQCQKVVPILALDGRGYLKHLMDIFEWKKWNLFFKKTVYNKTVIDWVRGQQQFCLTRGRICCPKPQVYRYYRYIIYIIKYYYLGMYTFTNAQASTRKPFTAKRNPVDWNNGFNRYFEKTLSCSLLYFLVELLKV